MKHLKIYILLLTLPCLALQCDNDDDDIGNGKDDKAKVIKMSDEFLSYFCFPEGSYWIYEEASSGEMDSAYIKWRNRRVYEPFYNGTDDYKIESYTLHEVIRDSVYYGGAQPFQIQDTLYQYVYQYNKTINQTTVNWEILSKYNKLSFLESDTFINNKYAYKRLKNFNVKDHSFKKVLRIDYQQHLNIPFKQIWYAKDIGVIRRDFWDGTSWRLVRYHHAN